MSQPGRAWLSILILAGVSLPAHAQARPLPGPDVQQIYQRLLPQIKRIPIFDHHAHPGFFDDPDVDAMAAPPGSAALRERDTNPELVAAAKALFAYPYNDLSPEHAKWEVFLKHALGLPAVLSSSSARSVLRRAQAAVFQTGKISENRRNC